MRASSHLQASTSGRGCTPAVSTCFAAPTSMQLGWRAAYDGPQRRHACVQAHAALVPSPPLPSQHTCAPSGPALTLESSQTGPANPSSFFSDELCPTDAHEQTVAWLKLRWCSNWQQVRTLYHSMRPSGGAVQQMQPPMHADIAAGVDGSVTIGEGNRWPLAGGVAARLHPAETYAFLIQLQDFFNNSTPQEELQDMAAFRSQLVDDLYAHLSVLDMEQCEAVACLAPLGTAAWTKERTDAVQLRLAELCVSAEAVTQAVNAIHALNAGGVLPHVALLQRLFRTAVECLGELPHTRWAALYRVARRFRFLVDDRWLDDLHAALMRDSAVQCLDYGRMLGVAGTLAAFVVNGTAEVLDTRVQTIVEVLERRFDVGRSLLTDQQVCLFARSLVELRSPSRSRWNRYVKEQLTACSAHLHSLSPGTIMLGVDLIVKGEGWVDKAALLRLMRHVVRTYASRPTQHNALTVATWLQRHAEQAHAAGGGSGDVPGGMQSSRDKAGSSRRSSSSHGGRGRRGQSFSDSLGAPGLSPPVPVLELQGLAGALMHGCADALQSGAMEASLVPSFMRCMALSQVPLEQAWVDVAYSVCAAQAPCLEAPVLLDLITSVSTYSLSPPLHALDACFMQYERFLPLMRPPEMLRMLELWTVRGYLPSQAVLEGLLGCMAGLLSMERDRSPSASTVVNVLTQGAGMHAANLPQKGPAFSFSSAPDSVHGQAGRSAGFSAARGAGPSVASASTTGPTMPSTITHTHMHRATSPGRTRMGHVRGYSHSMTLTALVDEGDGASAGSVDHGSAGSAYTVSKGADRTGAGGSEQLQGSRITLSPSEAQRLLGLLERYRELLVAAGRADLVSALNMHRNNVTAALYAMKRDAPGPRPSARMLSALLRSAQ